MDLTFNKSWLSSLQRKIKNPLVLFLDFDGTLAPIAPHPDQSFLDSSTKRLVQSISKKIPVVLISGRAQADLKKRVRLSGVTYVGNHGFEISGQNFQFRMKNETLWRKFLKNIRIQLEKRLDNLPGVWVENKKVTLSVHYRLARRETREKANQILQQQVKNFNDQGKIRLSGGKAVWEIRPPIEWNKGKAVLWVLKQPGFKRKWPLYIGDDQTDQDAMRLIRNKGIGIMVGPPSGKGAAHYTLNNPREVHRFLGWVLKNTSFKNPKKIQKR
ncbi:MAG TPA: trehalose-phosphatase [Nitrospiria bacterium]|jgi:alpha,alpha-trehalase